MASRRIAVWLLTGALAALPAPAAHAAAETLVRSLQNLALAPLDVALAPAVAGQAIYRNLQDSDEGLAAKVAFTLPGWVWNTGVGVFAGAMRGLAGALELPPGLVLAPFETQLDPLFDAVERSDALVDAELGALRLKFGIDYTSG